MSRLADNTEDSIEEQLANRYRELRAIAATCGLQEDDVRNEIADSMEEANSMTKPLDCLEDSYRWWADWWYRFLMEWVNRCFIRYVEKSRALYPHVLYSNYEGMRALWLSEFEPLWVAGSDIARLTRIHGIVRTMARFISHRANVYDESQQQSIGTWVNGFDDIALEVLDLVKRKQRGVFDSSLEWLEGHTKDVVSAELKRILSN